MIGSGSTYSGFYGVIRKAKPNPGHYALAQLEELGILKCVITQNIDALHRKAGNKKVIEYHGTVDKLRCNSCGRRFELEEISLEKIPPYCQCGGPIKYDVVHFNEPIPTDVMEDSKKEALLCDLMIICGTSAVVYPFANLPRVARFQPKSSMKIIEVNEGPTPLTQEAISDYLIQGKTEQLLPKIVEWVKELKR